MRKGKIVTRRKGTGRKETEVRNERRKEDRKKEK
jgi:hypothetical protein